MSRISMNKTKVIRLVNYFVEHTLSHSSLSNSTTESIGWALGEFIVSPQGMLSCCVTMPPCVTQLLDLLVLRNRGDSRVM